MYELNLHQNLGMNMSDMKAVKSCFRKDLYRLRAEQPALRCLYVKDLFEYLNDIPTYLDYRSPLVDLKDLIHTFKDPRCAYGICDEYLYVKAINPLRRQREALRDYLETSVVPYTSFM